MTVGKNSSVAEKKSDKKNQPSSCGGILKFDDEDIEPPKLLITSKSEEKLVEKVTKSGVYECYMIEKSFSRGKLENAGLQPL